VTSAIEFRLHSPERVCTHVVNDQYPYFVYVEESDDRAKQRFLSQLLALEEWPPRAGTCIVVSSDASLLSRIKREAYLVRSRSNKVSPIDHLTRLVVHMCCVLCFLIHSVSVRTQSYWLLSSMLFDLEVNVG
jgi:hypothetical protein